MFKKAKITEQDLHNVLDPIIKEHLSDYKIVLNEMVATLDYSNEEAFYIYIYVESRIKGKEHFKEKRKLLERAIRQTLEDHFDDRFAYCWISSKDITTDDLDPSLYREYIRNSYAEL